MTDEGPKPEGEPQRWTCLRTALVLALSGAAGAAAFAAVAHINLLRTQATVLPGVAIDASAADNFWSSSMSTYFRDLALYSVFSGLSALFVVLLFLASLSVSPYRVFGWVGGARRIECQEPGRLGGTQKDHYRSDEGSMPPSDRNSDPAIQSAHAASQSEIETTASAFAARPKLFFSRWSAFNLLLWIFMIFGCYCHGFFAIFYGIGAASPRLPIASAEYVAYRKAAQIARACEPGWEYFRAWDNYTRSLNSTSAHFSAPELGNSSSAKSVNSTLPDTWYSSVCWGGFLSFAYNTTHVFGVLLMLLFVSRYIDVASSQKYLQDLSTVSSRLLARTSKVLVIFSAFSHFAYYVVLCMRLPVWMPLILVYVADLGRVQSMLVSMQALQQAYLKVHPFLGIVLDLAVLFCVATHVLLLQSSSSIVRRVVVMASPWTVLSLAYYLAYPSSSTRAYLFFLSAFFQTWKIAPDTFSATFIIATANLALSTFCGMVLRWTIVTWRVFDENKNCCQQWFSQTQLVEYHKHLDTLGFELQSIAPKGKVPSLHADRVGRLLAEVRSLRNQYEIESPPRCSDCMMSLTLLQIVLCWTTLNAALVSSSSVAIYQVASIRYQTNGVVPAQDVTIWRSSPVWIQFGIFVFMAILSAVMQHLGFVGAPYDLAESLWNGLKRRCSRRQKGAVAPMTGAENDDKPLDPPLSPRMRNARSTRLMSFSLRDSGSPRQESELGGSPGKLGSGSIATAALPELFSGSWMNSTRVVPAFNLNKDRVAMKPLFQARHGTSEQMSFMVLVSNVLSSLVLLVAHIVSSQWTLHVYAEFWLPTASALNVDFLPVVPYAILLIISVGRIPLWSFLQEMNEATNAWLSLKFCEQHGRFPHWKQERNMRSHRLWVGHLLRFWDALTLRCAIKQTDGDAHLRPLRFFYRVFTHGSEQTERPRGCGNFCRESFMNFADGISVFGWPIVAVTAFAVFEFGASQRVFDYLRFDT